MDKMTPEKKYREFWIGYDEEVRSYFVQQDGTFKGDTHVIDIRALHNAQAEIKLHKQTIKMLDKADIELNKANAEIEKLKKRLAAFSHNHITRDIKDKGQCPACDQYHLKEENERYRKALGGFDD